MVQVKSFLRYIILCLQNKRTNNFLILFLQNVTYKVAEIYKSNKLIVRGNMPSNVAFEAPIE